ncbi:MAG: flagella basal body P-ring formation protein FlgA [Fibrobacteres bacterium]|nr:flagella basal body P-ring formation protein FlgA [Fibrobacterota bacterium]
MMNSFRACFLLLSGLQGAWTTADASVAAAAAPAQVSIRFRDQSFVEGEKIRLGDIARILAGGEHAVAELETLEVAKSAGFGLTRLLDTDVLFARFLQPYAGRFVFDYDHKTIRISTKAGKLPADSLARLVEAFVADMPKRSGEVRHWEIARAPAEIMVPVSPYSLELSFSGSKRKGKVDMNLSIRNESRILRNIPITINLRVEEPVLVAKTQIERDMPLNADNVAVEMRETTQMNEIAVGNPRKLIGFLAKVTINPGRIITPRVVAMPPAVKRGQEAKIVYRTGGVSVTADAVCRQDGLPGQIITAKSLVSQRLVRVRVTEDGWLEPVPGG